MHHNYGYQEFKYKKICFLFTATFDDDFYISSSNQPFEINQSQFFPGQKSNNSTNDTFEPNAADLTPLKPKNISMDR